MRFDFATAQQVLFGSGRAAELPALVAARGARALLVTGASRRFADRLEAVAVVAIAGEPSFDAIRAGVASAREARVDVVVAIGGGSVIDAGKAIAMLLANGGDPLDYAELIGAGRAITRPSIPFIAVPTTAGTGSEATRNAVLFSPEHRLKVSLRSPLMLPHVALVDPDLMLDLPPAQTAASGMDALAQLIEPFLSCKATPLVDALCRDGIPRVIRSLPRAVANGGDREARSDLALAALYSGMALANAGLGAVHGLAGPIGGLFDAPHGAVCAALLPGVFEKNFLSSSAKATEDAADDAKFAEVARLVTGRADATPREAVAVLRELVARVRIPGLASYGVRAEHAADIARKAQATSSMKGNPVALSDEALAQVVVAAL